VALRIASSDGVLRQAWLAPDDHGDAILWRHLERLVEPGPAGTLMLPNGTAKSTIVWWEKG